MKALSSILFTLFFHSILSQTPNDSIFHFKIPTNEINCMSHFNIHAIEVDPVNAFLLAKMTELMYPERLDYQIRYLKNGAKPVRSLPSTNWLKAHPLITNKNFKFAFEKRFVHYFSKSSDSIKSKVSFHYLEKFKFDTISIMGVKSVIGYDPELIIINTDSLLLLLYRGTDDVDNNRFAEWKGTDFNFSKVQSGSVFNSAKIHKGFLTSFELIKPELLSLLDSLNVKKKAIWISGHSLGGAMAILTGVFLEQSGYSIQNIYTYATPLTIGDQKFSELCDSLLPNKIHRFEYYLDPVTILSTAGFSTIGKRYWFDNATKDNYHYYPECEERHFAKKPFEYRRRPFANDVNRNLARVKREQNDLLITDLPTKLFYHNTQWYVYATYNLTPKHLKSELPEVDDSFPFIYYGWNMAK